MTGRPTTLQAKLADLKARQGEIVREIEQRSGSLNSELKSIANQLMVLENAQALLEGRNPLLGPQATPDHRDEYGFTDGQRGKYVGKVNTASINGNIDWSKFPAATIKGLTRHEALIKMAEWSGGVIRMKEIGQVLIDGGQSSQKHAWQASAQAYGAIAANRRFRKSGRGEYTLIP